MHTFQPLFRLLKTAIAGLALLFAHVAYAGGDIVGAVTFTFDDANASQMQYAYPLMRTYGQPGVVYVNTGFIGEEGYMTVDDLQELRDAGWELGGHTVTHAELPELPRYRARREIRQCYADLSDWGLRPENFASPFGAYDMVTLAEIAKTFNSHRGFHEIGYNKWPYNKYYLHVRQIKNTTTVDEVVGWMDEALSNGYWLIVVFHEVLPVVDPTDEYSWRTDQFEELLQIMNTRGIQARTVKDVIPKGNLLTNGSFEYGLDGMTNDPLSQWRFSRGVLIDRFNHGVYPEPKHSVRLYGKRRSATYLFGPKVPVRSDDVYGIRVFANTMRLREGELGYYIDEYDSDGNWISGQWLGRANLNFVLDESYQYRPSSNRVKYAAVQVYLTKGARGYAYVDGISFFRP